MKDFFARQDDARSRTTRLLLLFALAVAAVSLAVYLAALFAYLCSFRVSADEAVFWHPRLFLWTTGGTLLWITLGSLWKIGELREGGVTVAEILRARPVQPQTTDPKERQLRNLVEEMAIASAVPVPDIYLLDEERGINAFAAGYELSDAVLCVTRGAAELLDRGELQGIVAHEFSHILNGDMRLNLRLLGCLNGILLMSQAGERMLRGLRLTGGRGAGALFLMGISFYGIGYIGYFLGRLIKCAVSRQREYLGDASAVQFTRYPEGLAGALKKIGGLPKGSRLDHPRAAEISHLFFSNGLEEAWTHALDSHPPLADRILRLDPRFDGVFPQVTPLPAPPPREAYIKPRSPKIGPTPVTPLTGAAVAAALERIGDPLREHIDRARRLIAEIPEELASSARDPLGACALVYGLLFDGNPAIRTRQEEILNTRENAAIAGEIRRLSPALTSLAPEVRLPLLELSLPALRLLSPEQFFLLKQTVEQLSAADGKTSLFEFTLRYLIVRHLEPRFCRRPNRPTQIYGIRGVQQECSCVLSVLARVGHGDEGLARRAFERGVPILREPGTEFSFIPSSGCGRGCLERAFGTLESASPPIKRRLLAACLECLSHDGTVTVAEIELFRAIADAIGCPVPPWLDVTQSQAFENTSEYSDHYQRKKGESSCP
jgi:Zn-dependent protease with chaperone function